ncbi:MAG: hypothetical protein Q8898_16855 [Bacillota bacterium]|nr:hypothetical protein [Bacillota bacterium]
MLEVKGAKYELKYSADKDMFSVRVWGFYSPEDALAFIKDYTDITKKFKPEKTSLVIDGTDLLTSKPEAKVLLVECLKLYMQLPYKNRLFLKPKSATAGIMISSAMRDAGMKNGKDGLMLDDMKAIEDYLKVH